MPLRLKKSLTFEMQDELEKIRQRFADIHLSSIPKVLHDESTEKDLEDITTKLTSSRVTLENMLCETDVQEQIHFGRKSV